MQRIFLDTNLGDKEIILNDKEIYHQLTKVLRVKVWDNVIFFDWIKCEDFIYEIKSIDKKNIIFSFKEEKEKQFEELKINLYQSLPNKIDKIELIIQKWVEVWYSSFNFYKSERSQNLNISDNKIERFKKIILEAVEQSGRNIVPEINFYDKLILEDIKWQNIYFHTENDKSKKLEDIEIDEKCVNIFVWPEWWFSEKEILEFDKKGFLKVNLWENILRTETTWIVVGFFLLQKK